MRVICHYAVASHLGGGERSLLELLEALKARPDLGYAPWVIVPQEGPLTDALRVSQIRYTVLSFPQAFLKMSRSAPLLAAFQVLRAAPAMGLYFLRLCLLLIRERPIAIHTHSIKCHALAALAGSVTRIPVIWHLRDMIDLGFSGRILRAVKSLGKIFLIANSEATGLAFSQKLKFRVIYNGFSPEKYFPQPNRLFNQELGLSDHLPVVGIVGVLARWKGQHEFIQMAALLRDQGVKCHFVIIGAAIYDTVSDRGIETSLREEVRDLNLSSSVFFAGFRHDPAQVMNSLDVLVHASIRPEPFGRVVVEAMACGVPVVATRAGGVPEIIQEGQSGLLVPPGNVAAMAKAVRQVLSEPKLAEGLRQGGRSVFLKRFTREQSIREMASFYDWVSSR